MKKRLMVALLVLAAMLVCVAAASAEIFVPLTVDEVPNLPEMPQGPEFTLVTEEDRYVLKTDWKDFFVDYGLRIWANSYDENGEDYVEQEIEFSYDETTSSFVSDSVLTIPENDVTNTTLLFVGDLYRDDTGRWDDSVNIHYNLKTLEKNSCFLTTWRDDRQVDYTWQNEQLVEWNNWSDWSDSSLSVNFDDNGDIMRYGYIPSNAGDTSFPTVYTREGDMLQCGFVVDGTEYAYFDNTWCLITDDNPWGEPVAPPEGYDLAKLRELFPPLIDPVPTSTASPSTEPTAAPTAEPTAAPSDEPTSEPTPEATPAPTADPTAEPTVAPTAEPTPTPTPTPSPYTWYSHNTQGLVGLPLRDLYPDLTDKWYNVVPVDLTVQGRQAYPLVASNLFHMGTAYVDILGDSVTVTYKTPGNKWTAYLAVEDEALAWFTAPGDITTEFLENPAGEVAFGEPVSISESLNGQDVALLFICNHVTYRQPCLGDTGYLTRYWPNLPEWKEYREGLMMLLERMGE